MMSLKSTNEDFYLHSWKIKNFLNLILNPTKTSIFLHSSSFPSNNDFQFSLRIVVNFKKKYLNLFLHLEKNEKKQEKMVDVCFQFQIENQNAIIYQSETNKQTFFENNCFGFENCFEIEKLKCFLEDTIVINCKIFFSDEIKKSILENESFTETTANIPMIHFSNEIVIDNFATLYFVENSVIKSNIFFPQDNPDIKFYIVLSKNTKNEKEFLSVFIKYFSKTKKNIFLSWKISILTWDKRTFITGEGSQTVTSGTFLGSSKFIKIEDLFNFKNMLLTNSNIIFFVEVKV